MTALLRPGAYVNEVLTASNSNVGATADSVGAFLGASNRGPVKPTLIRSWSEYTAYFGDFTNSAYLAYAVYLFFVNGGHQCWVTRVAHTDAVVATRSFSDSTNPSLKINALNAGAWGNSIYVDIVAGYDSTHFNLVIYYGAATQANVVETWNDLSMVSTDVKYAPSTVNGNSHYVSLVDLASVTANNTPVAASGQPLATGVDGSAAVAADYSASAALLAAINSPLVLNLAGVTDSATINGVLTVTNPLGNVFVILDVPAGQTSAQALTDAAGYTATSYAAAYYPWIVVNDPAKYTANSTKTLPPGGAMVGQYVATDAAYGPFKTPAGVYNRIAGAIDLETTLQPTDYDNLNSTNPPVNAIKPVPGYGICAFGGRTLKGGQSDKYIAVRRSLIYIEQSLKNITRFAIFQPNDERLWRQITSKVSDFLLAYYAKGGLKGNTPQEAFFVVCDSTNNTSATVANGVVNLAAGVSLEYPAEFIVITVGQFDGGSTVTNSLAQ